MLGLRCCCCCCAATFSPRARAKNCFAHSCRTCDIMDRSLPLRNKNQKPAQRHVWTLRAAVTLLQLSC